VRLNAANLPLTAVAAVFALGLVAHPAGADFLWAGANQPFLYLDPVDEIVETLDALDASDLRVLRVMLAYQFEPDTPGVYDFSILDRLDYLIQEARKRGVVLMIVFDTSYYLWPGNESSYLDYFTATEFFTEPLARMLYKNRIEAILNHEHPLYERPYKDIDDVIWAWELMNEPWIRDEFPEPDIPDSLKYEHMRSWLGEMASFVKLHDPTTLVSLGIAGYSRYYGSECGDDIQTLGVIPDAGIYTLHFYGGALSTWINDARVVTEPAGKLLFVEEFGKTRSEGMPAIISFYTYVTSECLSTECPWMFWRVGRSKAETSWQIWTDDDVWWNPVDPASHTTWATATDQPWTVDAHVTACRPYWDRCEDLSLHGWSVPEGPQAGDAVSVRLSSQVVREGDYSLECAFDPEQSEASFATFTADGRTPYHWGFVDTLRLCVFSTSDWTVDLTISCENGSGGTVDTLERSYTLVPQTWYTMAKFALDRITDRSDITELIITVSDYITPGSLFLDAMRLSEFLPGEEITTEDSLVIESFETYEDTDDLQESWYEKPVDGNVIESWELWWDNPAGGEKSMRVEFDLNQSPWWGGVEYAFDCPIDVSGFDGIDVALRGTEGVYLTFQIADESGSYANYDYLVCLPEWTFHHVPLDSFSGEWVNTARLKRIAFFTTWAGVTSGFFWVDEISAADPGYSSVDRSGHVSGHESSGLGRNFPNPFNPSTTIPFSLRQSQEVSLSIYDILGRRVRTLLSKRLEPGPYQVIWDARDDRGLKVSCGVYLCIMRTPTICYTRKVVVVR
jgi:hypothetical protein